MKVNIFLTIYSMLLLLSCKKNEHDPAFKGENQLVIGADYLQNSAVDSMLFSFSEYAPDVVEGIVNINVRVSGEVANFDREFSLAVDPALTTAKPEEYEIPSKMVVPANAIEATTQIKVKRTSRLTTEIAGIYLKVQSNQYFKPGTLTKVYFTPSDIQYPIYINFGPAFKIRWTDVLVKPPTWDYAGTGVASYWGAWSPAKHKFIIDSTGVRSYVDLPDLTKQALTNQLNEMLMEYNAANPSQPLLDLSGNPIGFCWGCN